MQIEMVSALLLPLGIWLILSASIPDRLHRRLAAAALTALAVASLTYAVLGFGLMFGGVSVVDPAPGLTGLDAAVTLLGPARPWILLGGEGFLLHDSITLAGLSLFVSHWPLVITCALLVAGALAQYARTAIQVALTVVIAGIALPIAGCWVWGGGWLSALGVNANLGQGVIDLSRLATVGLVAGGAVAAWLVRTPRRELAGQQKLPTTYVPARTVTGVICVLISALPFSVDQTLGLGQFVNSSITVSVAILTAGAYTLFTTRNTDALSASRAALAAVFIASAGGALLPPWVLIALGIVCGLLATLGYYAVNERWQWRDDSAIITAVLVPAAIGMAAVGIFVSGISSVAGLLPGDGVPPDPGQLIAQLSGIAAIALLSFGACSGVIALARRLNASLLLPVELIHTPPPVPANGAAVSVAGTTLPEISITYAEPMEAIPANAALALEGEAIPAEVKHEQVVQAEKASKRKGVLSWLRRSEPDSLAPVQPRKVAYPVRVGGRRLSTRPLSADGDAGTGAGAAQPSPD